jgi:hypothetical protein
MSGDAVGPSVNVDSNEQQLGSSEIEQGADVEDDICDLDRDEGTARILEGNILDYESSNSYRSFYPDTAGKSQFVTLSNAVQTPPRDLTQVKSYRQQNDFRTLLNHE